MYVIMFVAFGLGALAVFWLMGSALTRAGVPVSAPRIFIGVWLVAALLNSAVGVFKANVPVVNEIGAFIPIFGIPALAAWYLSRRVPRPEPNA